ncbi:hypothetical protein COJ75_29595 [Bacillus thuringiensis]|nr:hypothetical protein COJ75_29595 [Bacillus thuringiensis]
MNLKKTLVTTGLIAAIFANPLYFTSSYAESAITPKEKINQLTDQPISNGQYRMITTLNYPHFHFV